MKKLLLLFLVSITNFIFSQQVSIKTFQTKMLNIAIETSGLDEIKIINSTNNQVEISLFDENPNSHIIGIKEEFDVLKIEFKLDFIKEPEVFRKFITERIDRASAVIKLPKNKKVSIHGNYVDVISKSYQGDLNIYLEKGLVRLDEVQQNIFIKIFQGNVFATLYDSNVDVSSKEGFIKVNDSLFHENYKKRRKNVLKNFKFNSIQGNLTLSHDFK